MALFPDWSACVSIRTVPFDMSACPAGFYRCNSSGLCVPPEYKCDLATDCFPARPLTEETDLGDETDNCRK